MHRFQNVFLSGGIFAVILFLFVTASALFRLEPLDLRERWIYALCLIGGLFFGLLMEFGSIIPNHTIVVPLVGLAATLVAVLVSSFR
jgi:hypothetical protein